MIGLADCNNFFVSCERSRDASLNGKAVVVLSNNDGCVVARSNEAKKMGVKMGQPCFEIKNDIRAGKIIALSGDHLLYRSISLHVHDILREYAPSTIDYSIDESFLLMDGVPSYMLEVIGKEISERCMKEVKIPVTIGFAKSKTLAKIATHFAKKNGLQTYVLDNDAIAYQLMSKLPVSDTWGIGRRLSKRLLTMGVYTIANLYDINLITIRKAFGVNGERCWRELHGENCIELTHTSHERQESISETRTFPVDIDDFDYLRSRFAIYCAHCGKRLRAMKSECRILTVFLRTNRFHLENGYFRPEASCRFPVPVSDTTVLTKASIHLLEKIYDTSLRYKRGGIVLSEITPVMPIVPSLFEDIERQNETLKKSRNLMGVIDDVNAFSGPHVIKLASQIAKNHIGHNDGYSSSFGAPLPDGYTDLD